MVTKQINLNLQTVIVSTKYLDIEKHAVTVLMSEIGYVEFDQRHSDEYWANNNIIFTRPENNKRG